MSKGKLTTTEKKPRAPRPLSPKQYGLLLRLRRGWRIMFGPTGSSRHVNGGASFSFGEMLCPPGQDSGLTVQTRMLDALIKRGLLEEVPREKPLDTSSIGAILRGQSEPREAYRLTALGKQGSTP